MDDNGEVLLGGVAIAAEIARLTGKPVSPTRPTAGQRTGRSRRRKLGSSSPPRRRPYARAFNRTQRRLIKRVAATPASDPSGACTQSQTETWRCTG
jgi:hypothetical protein